MFMRKKTQDWIHFEMCRSCRKRAAKCSKVNRLACINALAVNDMLREFGAEALKVGPYEGLIQIRYLPEKNRFVRPTRKSMNFETDHPEFVVITDIFKYITADELFMFRHDNGLCMFPYRENKKILVEIYIDEGN